MGEWQRSAFRDICEHSAFGPRFSSDEYAPDGNVACLRTTDIDSNGRIDLAAMPLARLDLARFRNHILQRDDVVVTRTGAYLGKAAVFCDFRLPVLPGAFSIRFRIKRSIADPYFVRYYFNGPEGQAAIQSIATGSAQPNINIPNLHSLNIPLPPLTEQRTIVSVLGALDDKIELNRKMNETLEDMARALFKSWFVDFDPVSAKAEGRQPNGMDAETAKLFPSEFVDSELGMIPKGWKLAPLGEYVDTFSGGTPSKSNPEFWGGDMPWISPKVMTAIHADDAEAFVSSDAVGKGTRLAPAGSTLVMVRGMGLHEKVRVSQNRWQVTFNQDVKALVPKAIEPSLLLFELLDSQQELLGRVESSGHGTGRLPSEILLGHPVVMPPRDVQKALVAHFDSINDSIALRRAESRTLTTVRDCLLPRLLSGVLSVRDASRFVEVSP